MASSCPSYPSLSTRTSLNSLLTRILAPTLRYLVRPTQRRSEIRALFAVLFCIVLVPCSQLGLIFDFGDEDLVDEIVGCEVPWLLELNLAFYGGVGPIIVLAQLALDLASSWFHTRRSLSLRRCTWYRVR